MFRIILRSLLLTLPLLVFAQEPVPQVDGDCPTGYTTSGDFCRSILSSKSNEKDVIEKRGVNCPAGYQRSGSGHCKQAWNSDLVAIPKSDKGCPTGYRSSGDYCKPIYSSTSDEQRVIEKVGSNCPIGFRSSGNYCKSFSSSNAKALPRKNDAECPTGYRTSGNYCVEL